MLLKLEGLTLSTSIRKTRTALSLTSLSPEIQDLVKKGKRVEKYLAMKREIMEMWNLKSA